MLIFLPPPHTLSPLQRKSCQKKVSKLIIINYHCFFFRIHTRKQHQPSRHAIHAFPHPTTQHVARPASPTPTTYHVRGRTNIIHPKKSNLSSPSPLSISREWTPTCSNPSFFVFLQHHPINPPCMVPAAAHVDTWPLRISG